MALAANATTMPVMTSACGIGIGVKARARAASGDHAEQQEHPAAQHAEGQNLAQRLGRHEEPVEADPDQRRAGHPRDGGGVHEVPPRGGPAISIGIDAAIERSMNASTNRITGFTNPAG